MDRRGVSRGQRALVITVVIGTIVIAMIGFVGSYAAVLRLAQHNGFGWFSYLLPIGIDIGITVFLALDLLLTWMRIPLPVLRQLAWVLTAATIVFNAASAWPNPLSSGMHAVVPLLFVAAIEAARHTVGRMAQIEANTLFERTRLGRWIWSPIATMRLFRRRMLWELRSYDEALEMERRRLVYRARLRAAYGRFWRYRAPVDAMLLLKLANLGEPLPEFKLERMPELPALALGAAEPAVAAPAVTAPAVTAPAIPRQREEEPQEPEELEEADDPDELDESVQVLDAVSGEEIRVGAATAAAPAVPAEAVASVVEADGAGVAPAEAPQAAADVLAEAAAVAPGAPEVPVVAEQANAAAPGTLQGSAVDRYRAAFHHYTAHHGAFPDSEQLSKWLFEQFGAAGRTGEPLSPRHLRRHLDGFQVEWQQAAVAAEPARDPGVASG